VLTDLVLGQREQHFALLELISHPVWIFDIDLRCIHWANRAALEVWDASALLELCQRDMGSDMSDSVKKRLAQYQSDFSASGATFNEQWTLYPGGVPVSLHLRFSGYALPDARMAMLCHAKPVVTETPESLRSVDALLHTPVMISMYDSAGHPLYRNPAARASVGATHETLESRIVDPAAYARLMQTLQTEQPATFTLAMRTVDGEQWHELAAKRCLDAATGDAAILVSETNVSILKRTEARAHFLAHHDGLTGLPNRAQVIARFAGAVEAIRQAGCEAALVFMDLDHFKDVNDTLGHAAGDELLVQIAARLRNATRSTDLVARLGGDEFLILVASQDILAEVSRVRDRILHSVSLPTVLRGTSVRVTPTMGVSLYPRDGTDLETLLRKADLAMYSGKQRGRNDLAFYNEGMGTAVSERMQLESDLRSALERQEFELHYQPIVVTGTLGISGVEALLRWRHPVRGLVGPDLFIPLCETTGMITPLGQWVFAQAARQQAAWAQDGHCLHMHVNLSPRQFQDPELVHTMQRAMQASGCDPTRMGVEITESMLMGRDEHTASVLAAISALGMSIALDDFGTGYSNLGYLQRYPIGTLKIDKSFIQGSDSQKPLAELIVSLGHKLGMQVLAEGVETQEQLDWVIRHGIAHFQGYWFSKPLPATELRALLLANLSRVPVPH